MRSLRLLFFIFAAGALFAGIYNLSQKNFTAEPAGKKEKLSIYKTFENLKWINTKRPLTEDDLLGKVVLLDFWTYCCINCIHALPHLKRLEEEFSTELIVIGVHSPKFKGERVTANILEAVDRYNISHPVINDAEMLLWQNFQISAWPSFALLDPKGRFRGKLSGEGHFSQLREAIIQIIAESKNEDSLRPSEMDLLVSNDEKNFLRFPSKLAKSEMFPGKFWLTDSNHHRILRLNPEGVVDLIIGSGSAGPKDGSFETAEFNQPHGLVEHKGFLYVADTSNHMLRRVNLKAQKVERLSGQGNRGFIRDPAGRSALELELASPWDVQLWKNPNTKQEALIIAMAGTHQLWTMDLKTEKMHLFAGSGREDLADAKSQKASLAQPSGLFTSGDRVYFLDSETSSLRYVEKAEVKTLVGKGLFDYGLIDGDSNTARLQHALGGDIRGDKIYVADTYNNAIRVWDLKTSNLSTLMKGAGLNEPNDVLVDGSTLWVVNTNAHSLQRIDLSTEKPVLAAVQLRLAERLASSE